MVDYGLGLEKEYRVAKRTGDKFKFYHPSGRIPRGYGGDEPIYLSSSGEVNKASRGEKIALMHEDPTVRPGYEIATQGWQGDNIENQVKKLRVVEQWTRGNDPSKNIIFPFGINIGEQQGSKSEGGSYHLSITPPAINSTDGTRNRQKRVIKGAAHIQWIEPLITSLVGTANDTSVGDQSGGNTEASIRHQKDSYGNMGAIKLSVLENDWTSSDNHKWFHGDSSLMAKNSWRTKAKLQATARLPRVTDVMERGNNGVEIRFLDVFDSQNIEDVSKVLLYAMANGAERKYNETLVVPGDDDDWNDAAAKVMEEGYNAIIPKEYVDKLRLHLGIPVNTKSLRAEDVSRQVFKELWKNNKNTKIAKKLIKNNAKEPKVHNFNRDSWAFWFKTQLREKETLREQLSELFSKLDSLDTTASGGWIGSGSEVGGFKHILHETMGVDYTNEDARDLIDLFETIGILQVDRTPKGYIKRIKLKKSDAALEKELTKFVNDTGYFLNEKESGIKDYNEGAVGAVVAPTVARVAENEIFSAVFKSSLNISYVPLEIKVVRQGDDYILSKRFGLLNGTWNSHPTYNSLTAVQNALKIELKHALVVRLLAYKTFHHEGGRVLNQTVVDYLSSRYNNNRLIDISAKTGHTNKYISVIRADAAGETGYKLFFHGDSGAIQNLDTFMYAHTSLETFKRWFKSFLEDKNNAYTLKIMGNESTMDAVQLKEIAQAIINAEQGQDIYRFVLKAPMTGRSSYINGLLKHDSGTYKLYYINYTSPNITASFTEDNRVAGGWTNIEDAINVFKNTLLPRFVSEGYTSLYNEQIGVGVSSQHRDIALRFRTLIKNALNSQEKELIKLEVTMWNVNHDATATLKIIRKFGNYNFVVNPFSGGGFRNIINSSVLVDVAYKFRDKLKAFVNNSMNSNVYPKKYDLTIASTSELSSAEKRIIDSLKSYINGSWARKVRSQRQAGERNRRTPSRPVRVRRHRATRQITRTPTRQTNESGEHASDGRIITDDISYAMNHADTHIFRGAL